MGVRRTCYRDGCNTSFDVYPSSKKRYCTRPCMYKCPEFLRSLNPGAHYITRANEQYPGMGWCSECMNWVDIRKRTGTNNWRCKALERSRERRKNYNLTESRVSQMFLEQDGDCAICHDSLNGSFHIDHDHSCCPEKGKSCGRCVRGLLCSGCNTAIGLLKEEPEIMLRAVEYIKAARGLTDPRPSATLIP